MWLDGVSWFQVHVGAIFSSCDSFVVTNCRTSTDPTRLVLKEDQFVYVYDLTCFTSMLHPHADFLWDLGNYCMDTTVTIFDTHTGIRDISLGTLVHDLYKLHSNAYFSLERVSGHTALFENGPGGFLGIGGNIQSAKFLHGAVMFQLTTTENENNCAGDDGQKVCDEIVSSEQALRTLGTIQTSKQHRTDEGTCVCLKRSLCQTGKRLIHGQLGALPSMEFPRKSEKVDFRYPRVARMTENQRRNCAISSLNSSIQKMYQHKDTEWGGVLLRLLRFFYFHAGIPVGGNQTMSGNRMIGTCLPLSSVIVTANPVKYMIENHYLGFATMRVHEHLPYEEEFEDLSIGYSFKSNSCKYLKLLETLGYVRSAVCHEVYAGEEGYMKMRYRSFPLPPQVYEYIVIERVPIRLKTDCF